MPFRTVDEQFYNHSISFFKGEEGYFLIEEEDSLKESSLSIESTSYAILTSLAMNDLDIVKPFVNFLLRAMKPGGVFVSSQVTCCKEFKLMILNIYLNASTCQFQDSHVALKALSQYFRLYNDYHEHEHVNVDVKVTLSDKKQLSFKVLSPFFVGSLYFGVWCFNGLIIYYFSNLLIISITIFKHSNLSLSSSLEVESSGEGMLLVQVC